MKILSLIFILLCLLGCAVPKPETRAALVVSISSAQPLSVTPPPVIHHVWFQNGTNWPDSDTWTNQWSFSALVTADLTVPLAQWQVVTPLFEMYQGHLAFQLVEAGPHLFCRGLFQPK